MAKLKLDNGNTLRIKAVKDEDDGSINITVRNSDSEEDNYWFIGSVGTDGIFHVIPGLKGKIVEGLQYEADGGIKVERE